MWDANNWKQITVKVELKLIYKPGGGGLLKYDLGRDVPLRLEK